VNPNSEINIPNKNEVDANLFMNRLIKSKKLIAFITIFITLIAAIYSIVKTPEFKTTGLIEIGQYNLFFDNDAKIAKIARISAIYTDSESLDALIESQRILIDDLKTQFIHKYKETSSVNSLTIIPVQNSLIKVSVTSNSIKDSEDLVYKISSYVHEKHEDTTNNLDQSIKQRILDQLTFAKTSVKHNQNTLRIQRNAMLDKFLTEKKGFLNKIDVLNTNINIINERLIVLENIPSSSNESIEKQELLIDLELRSQNLSEEILRTELELSRIGRIISELKTAEGSSNSNLIEEDDRLGYEQRVPALILKDSLLIDKLTKNLKVLDSRLKTKSQLVRIDTSKSNTFIFYTIFGFIFGLALSIAIVITFHSLRILKTSS
tara:strand:- start:645 stop:1775 length:1131 start_codon:yes stop_codon:yes gene_type:complete